MSRKSDVDDLICFFDYVLDILGDAKIENDNYILEVCNDDDYERIIAAMSVATMLEEIEREETDND